MARNIPSALEPTGMNDVLLELAHQICDVLEVAILVALRDIFHGEVHALLVVHHSRLREGDQRGSAELLVPPEEGRQRVQGNCEETSSTSCSTNGVYYKFEQRVTDIFGKRTVFANLETKLEETFAKHIDPTNT